MASVFGALAGLSNLWSNGGLGFGHGFWIGLDPLVIVGGIGETVDLLLGDGDVIRGPDFLSGENLKIGMIGYYPHLSFIFMNSCQAGWA